VRSEPASAASVQTPLGARAHASGGNYVAVMLFDAVDAGPVPMPFLAFTVKVYETPVVRPLTVQEVEAVVHVKLPELDVTV
jgi:hypothetical protein